VDITKLKAELARDEGLRLKPYLDSVRKLTIGYGRNLTDVGISLEEAAYLLDADVARAVKDLDDALPWWIKLDEVRQRVLVNMAFNMGIFGLLGFTNTLNFMEMGMYEAAADGMLKSLWARQVGPRADRLAEMMRTGLEPKETL
jgi:lysozyme